MKTEKDRCEARVRLARKNYKRADRKLRTMMRRNARTRSVKRQSRRAETRRQGLIVALQRLAFERVTL